MATFGSFALLIALALAAYNLLAGALALRVLATGQSSPISPERLADTARRAGIAGFVAITAAAFALIWSVFTNDFSIAYILEHSNRALPGPYKFSALWSGQEGSLLLWAWLLATYGFVLRLTHKTDVKLYAYAGTILASIQVFFLLILNFAAPPFALFRGAIPEDGNGLNPLLQYPEMVIHPPMLYLGYVGFAVPFCFGLGALMMRYPGEKWIKTTRVWTMVTWLFLTCGIFLGMHWAYSVLGWGGYWGWDPVESASFMPWLTGTAFLHSVMMQEKRGMLKVWNMWLIFITFGLCIFGTFLTRSGVVSSVHAFAQSSIGDWFVAFLALIAATCAFFFFKNKAHLRSEHKLESIVSRESSFLFNNLLFVLFCFTVLWGTLFPILSEWVQGTKVTVGPPFFNKVAIPVALLLLLLTAVGPLLAWRKTSLDSIKRNFMWPAIGALLVGVLMLAFGVRPWQDFSYFYAIMAAMLATLVALTVISEFIRGGRVISRHTGQNLLASMAHLCHRNTRRYGGYIVHFGVAVVIIGFLGSAFNQDREKEMGFGDKLDIGGYTLVCQSYTQDDNPNYQSEWAVMDVYRGGQKLTTMYPERRFFHASQQTATMVANRSTMKEDLYVVYEGLNQDTGRPIIKVHLNPLVMWIWVGVWLIIAGTVVALIPNAVAVRVPAPARVAATVSSGA